MSKFSLKNCDSYYLQLSEQPIKFDAWGQLTNVFFDDTNGQVFAIRSGGVTGVTVRGLDDSTFSFRMEDKGTVVSIKFSPDQRVLAIQRTNASVEFVNFDNFAPTADEYSHNCKWKNASVLGFVWPKVNEIAFITDHGIELLQVMSEKKQLKSLKTSSFSGAWFSWCAQSKIVLLAGNNGAVLQPFSLANSTITKLQKMELEAGGPASERDVSVVRVNNTTWCALLRHSAAAAVQAPAEISLVPLSGPSALHHTHTLKTGLVGRFIINVVDDLVVVHHQASQTSILFDIMEDAKVENGVAVHVPITIGKTLKPVELNDQPLSMYSSNWVAFQPNIIIDARLGCLWRVLFKCQGLTYSVPKEEISKMVAVLLRRTDGRQTVYDILNQMVDDADIYLSELSNVFDEINAVYRKWADLEIAKRTGHNANQTGDSMLKSVLSTNINLNVVITQPEIYANVFQAHTDAKYIVQVLTCYVASLCRYDITTQHAIAELCATTLVRRGQCQRLRQTIRHGCLGDSRPLACLLLSLGNLDPAAGQLALDMMWRLKAYEETVEVLLSCQDPVAAAGAAKQAGATTWNALPARKMLAAAKQQAELSKDPGVFKAIYHTLENRNRVTRGTTQFNKGAIFDEKFTWKPHPYRCTCLSSACYAIKIIKELCGMQAAKTVYYAYFDSLMSYGLLFWVNAAEVNRIFVLQKRALRCILSMKARDSCEHCDAYVQLYKTLATEHKT